MTIKLYHDDKNCGDILFCILSMVQKNMLDKVRDSRFFSVMIDESTDISITDQLIIFASFVTKDLPLCIFLGLLHIGEEKKHVCIIFETLTRSIKE